MTPGTRNGPGAAAGRPCGVHAIRPGWVILALLLELLGCGSPAVPELSGQDLATHNEAIGLMGQYRYEPAQEHFARLARRYPDRPELRVDLAIATLNRQQEGDEPTALKLLGEVLEHHPGNLRAHYCSGLLKLNAGDAAGAVPHFQQVAQADPGDAYAAYYLALSLAQQSRFEDALPWYRQAIKADPYLRSGYYGAFQSLRQLKQDDAAREMLDLYQRLGSNPKARVAEFKYTRMGPKAEVRPLTVRRDGSSPPPAGGLFAAGVPLPVQGPRPAITPALPERASLSAADLDGDGDLDVFAARLREDADRPNAVLRQEPDGSFELQPAHPLASVAGVNAALWGDIDNDGLLDVYLCRQGPNQLWRQTEPGHWQDMTAASVTAGGDHDTLDGALFDADHDGDLDLFLVNGDAPNELLNNNRDGTFTALAAERGIAGGPGARGVLITDLDRDRDSDLIVLHAQPPHEVYLNDLLWSYRPAPGFEAFRAAPLAGVLAQDRDADGLPELYTRDRDGRLGRWQPDASGEWARTPLAREAPGASPASESGTDAGPMALLDVDGDGASELILSTPRGWSVHALEADRARLLGQIESPGIGHWIPLQTDVGAGPAVLALRDSEGLTLWRPGPGRYPFAGLQFSGGQDAGAAMRSNASGIGTYAAVRVDDRWTAIDTFRNYSGPGQSRQPLTIGLGGAARMDFLAIDWSDGVFQSELGLEAGRLHSISETQRQLSSCPVLFVWDGERYRFVSDLLGVGGIGYAIGPGEYAEPRPWENFQLPAGLPGPRAGRYLLKLTEPMEEAAYLDAVRLVAWDLPPGWQLVLDERLSIAGPAPTGQALFFRNERLPDRAVDQTGRDVTAALAQADRQAAPSGDLDRRFIGRLATEYQLVLDFAEPLDAPAGTPVLVVDGWVEYPYSQTRFAAWQAAAHYDAPSLDYQGPDGQWHVLSEQFGYPAGMPRRMSLPLTGLPSGVTRLRLRTNQEIYWDRLAVAYTEPSTEARRQPLPLHSASVRESGFPLRTSGAQRQPDYDYRNRAPLWDTRHMAGFYTAFGRMDELVAHADDAVAIIGPGEEIHLEFEAPGSPPAPGWSRILVLETNGWAKDMDLFTHSGETLSPLPTTGKPDTARELLHARFNTRYRSGQ